MIPRSVLFVLLTLAFLTSLILAQKPSPSAQTKRESGLSVTTFETRPGTIRVSLPDDMAAGDTISGTVTTEPAGKNDKDKQKNAGELNGYVIDLENQKTKVSSGVMQRVHLLPDIDAPSLILLDEKGKQIGTIVTPLQPAPTTGSNAFSFPTLGQAGRPIQIQGPFDGDSANTNVKVGTPAQVLAESPRKLVVESPRDIVGPTKIEVIENGSSATGPFRNLKIDLTAPKTSLLRGESTELHVEVQGLQGLTQPVQVQIQNQSPSTVNITGGNTQNIVVQPSQVTTGGTFSWSTNVTGQQSGGYRIVANVPSGALPLPLGPGKTNPTEKTACKCNHIEIKPPDDNGVKVLLANSIYQKDSAGHMIPFGLEFTASMKVGHKLLCDRGEPLHKCLARITWTVDPTKVEIIRFDKVKKDDNDWNYADGETPIVNLQEVENDIRKAHDEAQEKANAAAKKVPVRGKKPPAKNPAQPEEVPTPDIFFIAIPGQNYQPYNLPKMLGSPTFINEDNTDSIQMTGGSTCSSERDYTITRHFVVRIPKTYLDALKAAPVGASFTLSQDVKFAITWTPATGDSDCPVVHSVKEMSIPLYTKAQFNTKQINFFHGDW